MLEAFPKVRGFAMSKFVCSFLLEDLSRRYDVNVAVEAVRREVCAAQASLRNREGGDAIDYFLHNHCHFTLVTHGVCFHVDRGKGTTTSFLENRVVLVSDRNKKQPNVPEGRGYHSADKFQYALIDW